MAEFDDLWDYNHPGTTEEAFRPLLTGAHDGAYRGELLTQIARAQGLQQRFDDAHRTLDEVQSLLPTAEPRVRIRYLLERGRVYNSAGQPAEARPHFLQAWELARDVGEDFHAVDAAHMLAIVDPPAGQVEWAERAMRLSGESADPRAQAWLGPLLNNLGWTYHALGRYDQALSTFQTALAWQEAEGNEPDRRMAAWTVARALRSLERYEDALQMQEANRRALEAAGAPLGYVSEEIGECLLALGREEEARPYFAQAYAVLKDNPWLRRDEPERLARLARLGKIEQDDGRNVQPSQP